jgi:hypothetical protein
MYGGNAQAQCIGLPWEVDREDAVPERDGLSRRELIRKGVAVGGHLLWVAPVVQTLTPRVLAHELSGSFTCCQCTRTVGVDVQTRALLNAASDPTSCQAACQGQEPVGTWNMQDFHRDSTPFSAVGPSNHQVCSPH